MYIESAWRRKRGVINPLGEIDMAAVETSVALSDRIRSMRKAKGFTQEQLAYRAGMTLAVVRNIEQGKVDNPEWRTIRALARVLGASLDDLAVAADEPAEAVEPTIGRPRKEQERKGRKGGGK
jgi:transcriptional regulator with XRE-family HTH domain